jgi:hypothetical protein
MTENEKQVFSHKEASLYLGISIGSIEGKPQSGDRAA